MESENTNLIVVWGILGLLVAIYFAPTVLGFLFCTGSGIGIGTVIGILKTRKGNSP